MLKNISGPERANVLTHFPGMVFGVIGLGLFASLSAHWSVMVFSTGFLLMFSTSTIYHYLTATELKTKWRIADHISIYVLIAATYTPFIMLFMNTSKGQWILGILWSCVLIGSVLKVFFTGRFRVVSTIIYLIMGWMAIFAINDFLRFIPQNILLLIGLGGVFYTLGTIFYIWKSQPYNHAIWHLFVLGGAVSHWVAVWLSVS